MTAATLGATLILLLLAYAAARLTRRHVPELVGYLVVGALLGPTGARLLDSPALHGIRPVTVVPIAVLMFVIGERISLRALKASPWLTVIAPVGYVLTAATIFVGAWMAGAGVALAALLAVMGGGGAPMTVAAVVGGERDETGYGKCLIGLHASYDALAALAFAVVFPLAYVTSNASEGSSLLVSVFRLGVAGVGVGLLLGLTLSWSVLRLGGGRRTVIVTLAHIVLATGISVALGLSVPLAALVLGAVAASRSAPATARAIFDPVRRAEPALYLVFFTLAGAAIRLNALPELGLIGLAYLLSRVAGRFASARIARRRARLSHGEARSIALASLPHAGISVGLAAIAAAALPARGIATITLSGIVIFELIGALVVRAQLRTIPHKAREVGAAKLG